MSILPAPVAAWRGVQPSASRRRWAFGNCLMKLYMRARLPVRAVSKSCDLIALSSSVCGQVHGGGAWGEEQAGATATGRA